MIRLEAASTPAPLTKLVEVKALMKLWAVKKPIRVNKNIALALFGHGLIASSSPGFYSLTRLGIKTANVTEIITVEIPFALFLKFDSEQEIVKDFLQPKYNLWKLMVTTCVACGQESESLERIDDQDGNSGAYCKTCLDNGYEETVKQAKARRKNGVVSR